MPPPCVPAKRSPPCAKSANTVRFVKPVLTGVHVKPLSLERCTPPPTVPAKISEPLTVNAKMVRFVKPVFTAVHVVPPSDERKIPPPPVPTKIKGAFWVNEKILRLVILALIGNHVWAWSIGATGKTAQTFASMTYKAERINVRIEKSAFIEGAYVLEIKDGEGECVVPTRYRQKYTNDRR